MMHRLSARESSDGNFLFKFWVIFVAITEFVFCLSNSVFSDFFRLFGRKPRGLLTCQPEKLISIALVLSRPCDFVRKKEFSCEFFRFFHHLFSLCLLVICVVSRTASERLLLKFHYTWRLPFNFQSWNISSCKWSRRPFLQYNWVFQFVAEYAKSDFWQLNLGVIFTFKTTYTEGVLR